MSKRFLTSAALAAASLALAQAAHAGVVTFDDRVFVDPSDLQAEANHFDEQGLHFEGYEFFFVASNNPDVVLPTGDNSTFMETGLEAVAISRTGGEAFDFLSIALGLGAYNLGASDNVLVTGTKFRVAWKPEDQSFSLDTREGAVVVSSACLPAARTVRGGESVKR